jgi:hypothetical protein
VSRATATNEAPWGAGQSDMEKFPYFEKKVREVKNKQYQWAAGSMEEFFTRTHTCQSLKHQVFDLSGSWDGSDNIRGCDTCKYFSHYDSSG